MTVRRACLLSALLATVAVSCTTSRAREEDARPSAADGQRSRDALRTSPPLPRSAYSDACSRRGADDDVACREGEGQISAFLRRRPASVDSAAPCPVASGYAFDNGQFVGIALGDRERPIAPLVPKPFLGASDGLLARLSAKRDGTDRLTFKTLWFVKPGYTAAFLVRGRRLDSPGDVRFGEDGSLDNIAVRGPTSNGSNGYREVPGGTYVREPGCYAWDVDGVSLHYSIVFQVLEPGNPR